MRLSNAAQRLTPSTQKVLLGLLCEKGVDHGFRPETWAMAAGVVEALVDAILPEEDLNQFGVLGLDALLPAWQRQRSRGEALAIAYELRHSPAPGDSMRTPPPIEAQLQDLG